MNPTQVDTVFLGGQSLGIYNPVDTVPAIGTLTFIEPSLYRYGAIGHYLPSCSSKNIKDYGIRASSIHAIQKAKNEVSGAKVGTLKASGLSGSIKRNTKHGIFGSIRGFKPNPFFKEPIPVGSLEDLHTGSAKIYTVIHNETVDEFEIMIESYYIKPLRTPYFVLKTGDKHLVDQTGGVVKGMSGSPIVQKGKLIGALSHVSANDPRRAYGIFIGNMINDLRWEEKQFSLQAIRKFFAIPLRLKES